MMVVRIVVRSWTPNADVLVWEVALQASATASPCLTNLFADPGDPAIAAWNKASAEDSRDLGLQTNAAALVSFLVEISVSSRIDRCSLGCLDSLQPVCSCRTISSIW